RQFRGGSLTDGLLKALRKYAIDPRRITIEITEDMLMEAGYVVKTLLDWKDLGVQVAIDDFGTGFSSFSYLKKFTPDVLKIDQSFIKDIEVDTSDAAIVSTTVAMGHKLGMKVVAEGVETTAQMSFLRRKGCDFAQGYFLAKPMAADELIQYLHEFQ